MQLCGREIGSTHPLFLITGNCVIESEESALRTAAEIAHIAERTGILTIYKSSFDKANRTAHDSFRGPGLEEGLRILERVRADSGLPVLTDVHEEAQVRAAADVVDVLQVPAFLSRQTDLLAAAARSGRPLNVKKGQFMAPQDTIPLAAKVRAVGGEGAPLMLCERGAAFGYNNLVVDMHGLAVMRRTGCPVVFDATHSAQQPGGQGRRSGGDRSAVPVLARAAVAAGVSGLFMETHARPDEALSDGPNSWPLERLEDLLLRLRDLDALVKAKPFEEDELPPAAG